MSEAATEIMDAAERRMRIGGYGEPRVSRRVAVFLLELSEIVPHQMGPQHVFCSNFWASPDSDWPQDPPSARLFPADCFVLVRHDLVQALQVPFALLPVARLIQCVNRF